MIDIKTIARNISLIENKSIGYEKIISSKDAVSSANIIGITGAPGTGKSTLTDKLTGCMVAQNKKVAVLCIDPSSPFNMGALLGDRIRMNQWYTNPLVYIRSLASRKALGGLSPMIIGITEYIKNAGFDFIIIETVGVGQSEIDVAGLADVTLVTLIPEGGDEIQTMKSGIMEIANIFVVNKCDRPGSEIFIKNLHYMLAPVFKNNERAIPVLKTIAEENVGVNELYEAIISFLELNITNERKYLFYAEKAFQLIQERRMEDVNSEELIEKIKSSMQSEDFDIFHFVEIYYS